jgi:hypothetical protein
MHTRCGDAGLGLVAVMLVDRSWAVAALTVTWMITRRWAWW